MLVLLLRDSEFQTEEVAKTNGGLCADTLPAQQPSGRAYPNQALHVAQQLFSCDGTIPNGRQRRGVSPLGIGPASWASRSGRSGHLHRRNPR
jgi:hypothetical protein